MFVIWMSQIYQPDVTFLCWTDQESEAAQDPTDAFKDITYWLFLLSRAHLENKDPVDPEERKERGWVTE